MPLRLGIHGRLAGSMRENSPQYFHQLYAEHVDCLRVAKDSLHGQLSLLLKEYINREFFRVRLTESRVKDASSLYRKVVEDGIAFESVFASPGTIRDLIGIRIVCHNLSDIKDIYGVIHDNFTVREVKGGSKNFVESPLEPTGYRAHHIDIVFKHQGREHQAEVQIRTLMQDAWATFMHDDVYKGPLRRFFSKDSSLSRLFRGSSDAIFGLDQMAQSLRSFIEQNPIDPMVRSTVGEALQLQMNTFMDFYLNRKSVTPTYRSVRRIDRYRVDGNDGIYEFWINAECEEESEFEFILGGDSGMQGIKDLRLFRADKIVASNEQIMALDYQEVQASFLDPSQNTITLRDWDRSQRRVHAYFVTCRWERVFTNPVEYIFAPWSRYYRSAEVSYTLEIDLNGTTRDPQLRPPRIYFCEPRDPTIDCCVADYLSKDHQLGLELNLDSETGLFRKEFGKIEKMLYCLMQLKLD
jgi:ppGpp synthetase/RelA/SpoT-type nucleotidyltranferase